MRGEVYMVGFVYMDYVVDMNIHTESKQYNVAMLLRRMNVVSEMSVIREMLMINLMNVSSKISCKGILNPNWN